MNLRGFGETSLRVNDGLTLLVGPNNCGKTSFLRLVDWFLNEARVEALSGAVNLTDEEAEMLLPARPTRNQARRLTLDVEIADGRTRRRYTKDGGSVASGEAGDEENRKLALTLAACRWQPTDCFHP